MLLFLLHFELVLNWALLTGCKATGGCYSIISQYRTVSHHDFHVLTKLVWRPAASALSSKWEQVAGQTGMLGGCARTTWTMFVEQSIRQMFNLLFVGEKLWIVLKACPISHHLFIVCPHPLISSWAPGLHFAAHELPTSFNAFIFTDKREGQEELPTPLGQSRSFDAGLLNPRLPIKSLQCLVVSNWFFRSFVIYSTCMAVWYVITSGAGWQMQSWDSLCPP